MTSIQWTNETWNPVTGCSKVSQGCKNCYAERIWKKVYGFRPFTDVQCHADRLDIPLRRKKPTMYFVNSMSDLFHEAVPFEFILAVLARCVTAEQHIFQILTKRPERVLEFDRWMTSEAPYSVAWRENIWLGVSVEDQKTADERIPVLFRTSARVRWISAEPLLNSIKLTRLHAHCPVHDFPGGFCSGPCPSLEMLDWVVIGGESGTKAASRPFDLRWAYDLVAQCQAADIPVFVKQLGRNPVFSGGDGKAAVTNLHLKDSHGGTIDEWPEDLRVREFPKTTVKRGTED